MTPPAGDRLPGRLAPRRPVHAGDHRHALELAGGRPRGARLLMAAIGDEDGLHWSDGGPTTASKSPPTATRPAAGLSFNTDRGHRLRRPGPHQRGDQVSTSRAAKWLVGQRNALGGFGSPCRGGPATLTQFAARPPRTWTTGTVRAAGPRGPDHAGPSTSCGDRVPDGGRRCRRRAGGSSPAAAIQPAAAGGR
jgi:hypothetical protein